jgi:hypothetical protein
MVSSCNGDTLNGLVTLGNKFLQSRQISKNGLTVFFPSKIFVVCQQDGQDRQLMIDFRSFQTFQEYYAKF